MPSVVLSSFLQLVFLRYSSYQTCVNALSRAFFISTNLTEDEVRPVINVSMPSVVLSSFLPALFSGLFAASNTCQCPQSCFLHFYYDLAFDNVGEVNCVNALSRAFFISTK